MLDFILRKKIWRIVFAVEDRIRQIDGNFIIPHSMKIKFDCCKSHEMAKLKQPDAKNKVNHWTLGINKNYVNGKNTEFIEFLIMHEFFHLWLGPDFETGINREVSIFATYRRKMCIFLSKLPDYMKLKMANYKKYDGSPYVTFEEIFIDYALLKIYESSSNKHIMMELDELKRILSSDYTNVQLLRFVDVEMPNLPKSIEKLITFKLHEKQGPVV